MSTTVAVGSMQVTSTSADADQMIADLTPEKEEQAKPRVLVDKGQAVEEPDPDSEAAKRLGKLGGEAAAKARAKAAKAKPIPDKKAKADGNRDATVGPENGAGDAESDADGVGGAEAEADEPAGAAEKRGNPRHDAQARIRELAEERKTEKARADRYEREAYEARQELARQREQAQGPRSTSPEARDGGAAGNLGPAVPAEDAEPEEGNFEFHKDYVKALARYEYRQAQKEDQRQQYAHAKASQYANEVNGKVGGWKEMLEKTYAEDPEFREAVKPVLSRIPYPTWLIQQDERGRWHDPHGVEVPKPDAANWISNELMSAPDRAPGLLRYFKEHSDDLQRLATLRTPADVIREMARIDARLEAATAGPSPKREVSKAKPPVTPVTGSPHTDTGEPDENAPLSTFVRRFGERELKASRR